jgi:aspartyl-tRNA(Asn)/glutamyl-tRNA(Gln) amidotransferase subunit A
MQEFYTYKNDTPDSRPAASGALAGKRVLVQPNMSVRGWLCNADSQALAGFTPLTDATVVARLTEAGAVLTGSSRMGELGFGLGANTTAALMADAQADVALVCDTLGEARLAAAGAGLFGFKPSYGRISRSGLIGLVPSMECCGFVAADPADILAVLGAIAGADPNDPSMPDDCGLAFNTGAASAAPKACTAGVIVESLDLLDAAQRSAFEAGLARLAAIGVTIEELRLPQYPLFRDVHQVIAAVEASSSAGKYDGVRFGHRSRNGKNWNEMYLNTRGEAFGTLIKSFLFQGAYFQFENYPAFENACRLRGRLVQATAELLGKVDLLVSPTRRPAHDPMRATTVTEVYEAFLATLPANVTGLPALHVPGETFDARQPDTGLQLIGARLDDARLLSIGMQLSSTARGGK